MRGLALVVLAFGVYFTNLPVAHASDPDGNPYLSNLAGQPICGYADSDVTPQCDNWPPPQGQPGEIACAGIAYANVGGKMALITAGHCQSDGMGNYFYGNLRGPNQSIIGFWGGDYQGSRNSYDVGVIWLYEGNWPAYRNRIIAGVPANGQYYTVTRADTPSSWGCSADLTGRTAYQAWQYHVGDGTFNRTGTLNTYNGTSGLCTYTTSLDQHNNGPLNTYVDSGTPWMLQYHTDAPFAVGSAATVPPVGKIIITPLYRGMSLLNDYFAASGGAHWCTSANCGGIGGY